MCHTQKVKSFGEEKKGHANCWNKLNRNKQKWFHKFTLIQYILLHNFTFFSLLLFSALFGCKRICAKTANAKFVCHVICIFTVYVYAWSTKIYLFFFPRNAQRNLIHSENKKMEINKVRTEYLIFFK